MRREGFLHRVGAQEEIDTREQAHLRGAFASPGDPVRGSEVRDILRQSPSEFDHPYG
jgi:hypothetical protein